MTGKDLIIYILKNNLEDEPVFKDGKFMGLLTAKEAAKKMDTGVATISALVYRGMIDGVFIGDELYIPANFKPPVES